VKASCEDNLAFGEASVALSKAKATTFLKTKNEIFAKGAKSKASLQTPQSLVLYQLGLIQPGSDINEFNNPDLRDYLSNKRKLHSEKLVDISLS